LAVLFIRLRAAFPFGPPPFPSGPTNNNELNDGLWWGWWVVGWLFGWFAGWSVDCGPNGNAARNLIKSTAK